MLVHDQKKINFFRKLYAFEYILSFRTEIYKLVRHSVLGEKVVVKFLANWE